MYQCIWYNKCPYLKCTIIWESFQDNDCCGSCILGDVHVMSFYGAKKVRRERKKRKKGDYCYFSLYALMDNSDWFYGSLFWAMEISLYIQNLTSTRLYRIGPSDLRGGSYFTSVYDVCPIMFRPGNPSSTFCNVWCGISS